MQKRLTILFTLICLGLPTLGQAKPPLVEFFTSTLCPKCPKPERYLAELDANNKAFVLSYHIDISDGRSHEPFATDKNEARQWLYQKKKGQKYVYTPNLVAMGTESGNAAFELSVDRIIEKGGTITQQSGIQITPVEDDGIRVIFPQTHSSLKDIWMVTFDKYLKEPFHAGPSNIVRTVERIGTWKGKKASYRIKNFSKNAGKHIAIIVQEPQSGPIIDYIIAER